MYVHMVRRSLNNTRWYKHPHSNPPIRTMSPDTASLSPLQINYLEAMINAPGGANIGHPFLPHPVVTLPL